IERDLLPWCEQHGMPVMAYSPLGGPGARLLRDPTLASIGAARGCSAAAVALAWTIRSGGVIAIPESGSPAHVKENAVALALTLTPQELQTMDAAHPRRLGRSIKGRVAAPAHRAGTIEHFLGTHLEDHIWIGAHPDATRRDLAQQRVEFGAVAPLV